MTSARARSEFLVFLMLTSTMLAMVGPALPVSADNETTSGTITGIERWSGNHQLTGDVTIAAGDVCGVVSTGCVGTCGGVSISSGS